MFLCQSSSVQRFPANNAKTTMHNWDCKTIIYIASVLYLPLSSVLIITYIIIISFSFLFFLSVKKDSFLKVMRYFLY